MGWAVNTNLEMLGVQKWIASSKYNTNNLTINRSTNKFRNLPKISVLIWGKYDSISENSPVKEKDIIYKNY